MNNNFALGLLGFYIASMFDPTHQEQIFPELPKLDPKEYENASKEKQQEMIKAAIDNDSFWGKFFKKLTNKEAEASLRAATEEIDAQILKLNKKRWEIMKEWVLEEKHKQKRVWKPSEEQMRILHIYADQNNYDGGVLTSLYQDLKILK